MKSNNKKIKWKETVLDTKLLSEFSKYGVSMIEEIDDPTGISIYDLGVSNDIKMKNKECKREADSKSELIVSDVVSSKTSTINNNSNYNIRLDNRKSKKRRETNKDVRNTKRKKNEKTLLKQGIEFSVDPEEHWGDYYELKKRLYEWTKIFDKCSDEYEEAYRNGDESNESKSLNLIIHPSILKGLSNLNFLKPTPIQQSCLIPAIRDRKDIIGAAETGSGKTLAYGIPIIANIMFMLQRKREKNEMKILKDDYFENTCDYTELNEHDNSIDEVSCDDKDDTVIELESLGFQTTNVIRVEDKFSEKDNKKTNYKLSAKLQALIILPSRELAIQVRDHLREVGKYTGLGIHAFVGGLSIEKQERLVKKKNVQLAIGTPGRLSALILENDFECEKNSRINIMDPKRETSIRFELDELRYLVLDEADRLVEQGHYRELRDILKHIYKTDVKNPNKVIRKIQTYLFSATLTLPNHLHPKFSKLNQKNNSNKQIKNKNLSNGAENKINNSIMSENSNKAMESLLQYIKLRENQVCVIDLSRFKTTINSGETVDSGEKSKLNSKLNGIIKLPKGLTISMIKCEADEIEMRLILYLLILFSPKWLESGKARGVNNINCTICPVSVNNSKLLLFVNSISYVYRLVPLLSLTLICKDLHQKDLPYKKKNKKNCNNNCFNNELKIIGIHGNMSQKQRIQSIETFKLSDSAILVCTDVLARGLDIENVDVVVHLQPPRNTSLMIHRSGRTARASKEGDCVLFCTPKDVMNYTKSLRAVSMSIESISVPLQMRNVVSSQIFHVQQRLELANEIEKLEHNILKRKKNNSWMINKANEADLELSDQEEYSITPEQIKAIQSLSQKKSLLLEFAKGFQKLY
ncbi:DEAD/H (Asp-Glu-Ala-Asp/His) box polypeptide [Cryptosporidium ryanae]|uniref:DEAD/H (Asp-Glu-Ala-Asp/His) box polypeptide n=1 Tax=Cryptosporidium ryanae TaxID=515981 RepID=UPI003519FBB1|nr:DEAD/H (Asp-Glu-Ala-Asp/His) box polypeptide [Cryptosporidium ryanae]